MTKHYYAAANQYGNATSIGFANTWDVYVFDSKRARDAWVDTPDDMSRRAIRRDQIGKYMSRQPVPFSGERYLLDTSDHECGAPYIATIVVDNLDYSDNRTPLNS